jgi:hypothetical protein
MAGIGLAEIFRVLGQQASEEVNPAEVTVGQPGQPRPNLGFQLHLIEVCHAFDAICILCYSQPRPSEPELSLVIKTGPLTRAGRGAQPAVELDRQTVGAQTMDHGVLPVLIGFPGVFVAALIGVTVPGTWLAT